MTHDTLLEEYKLNDFLTLKNKILMSPMTRVSADDEAVPTDIMTDYYARRAEAGLIITEGTIISPDGRGYAKVPGIFNHAQIRKWQQVTDAVHRRDGLIFMQIWHVGRVSHPVFLQGHLPISPSETTMTGPIKRMDGMFYGKSKAATIDEIQELIENYARAAKYARQAGFDGVEIHGANGYLIDQFLHYQTNQRTDEYGGVPENMARFALEVVRACGQMIGYERLGLRLTPGGYLNEIVGEERDAAVFKHLLEQLNQIPMAYVHTGNYDDARQFPELSNMRMTEFMRSIYKGTLIANGGYTIEDARVKQKVAAFNLISMGRPFIANPDLIRRIKENDVIQAFDNSMLNVLY